MGIVVFDADVLIAYRNRDDAHHREAVERIKLAFAPDVENRVCAVNLTEVMVGPLRLEGAMGGDRIMAMFTHFAFRIVRAGATLARGAAEVRAETNLKLPDAYVVATALAAAGDNEVRLESFDRDVIKAYQTLSQHH